MIRRDFLRTGAGAAAALVAGLPQAMADEAPVVRTAQGLVRGAAADGVSVFKGIQFAAPPVGPNLLRPPLPPASWDGVKDATAFGPKPPQSAYPDMVKPLIPPELVGPGDDCLTLNIWSADLDAAARPPVMVWIDGGMFQYPAAGASAVYEG